MNRLLAPHPDPKVQWLTGYEVALEAIVYGASVEELEELLTEAATDDERRGFLDGRKDHEGKH